MAVGGAVLALAAGLAVTSVTHAPAGADRVAASRPVERGAAEASFPEVGLAPNTYEPGHSSGWHTHPGVHSAVVLEGVLTIYDASCQRHDFGPGESYLGGRDPHLARNEGDTPVRLVVTYVFAQTSPLDHAAPAAPPAGCVARSASRRRAN